jgi:tRNA pseudouridine38-40 synthase
MPTYCLTVSYDGTDFVGWQRQANGPSIQGELEAALQRLIGHPVFCRGAGRTDAGVHASGQVASFHSERTFSQPERVLVFGTNSHLPPGIAVTAARIVADDFDARFSASGKHYRYHIWNAPVMSPLHARTHWRVSNRSTALDLESMQAAADLLTGRHDFSAFRAANCERRNTVRLVRRFAVTRPDSSEPVVHIDVEATAFLKQMMRILVGTLVEVGRGRMSVEHVAGLARTGDRTQAGPTAPAHGLRLCRVDYGPRPE